MSYSTAVLVPAISPNMQTFMYSGSGEYHGVAHPAASYYSNVGSRQTILYSLDNFDGLIEIQGTLVANPSEADWTVLFTVSTGENSGVRVLDGKYSKIRAIVKNFVGGVINDIRMTF